MQWSTPLTAACDLEVDPGHSPQYHLIRPTIWTNTCHYCLIFMPIQSTRTHHATRMEHYINPMQGVIFLFWAQLLQHRCIEL